MKDKKYFYDYLLKMLSIARIGLRYSKDEYALENYKDVQDETMKALESFMDIDFSRPNYFERNVYPTPNVSCRALIFNENNQLLMVQEKSDGGYSLPGGWCDLFDTPTEAMIRECKEEAGVDIEIITLLGVLSRKPLKDETWTPEYAMFYLCKVKQDNHTHDHEILNVNYFDVDNLPKLSGKITDTELNKILNAFKNGKIVID